MGKSNDILNKIFWICRRNRSKMQLKILQEPTSDRHDNGFNEQLSTEIVWKKSSSSELMILHAYCSYIWLVAIQINWLTSLWPAQLIFRNISSKLNCHFDTKYPHGERNQYILTETEIYHMKIYIYFQFGGGNKKKTFLLATVRLKFSVSL